MNEIKETTTTPVQSGEPPKASDATWADSSATALAVHTNVDKPEDTRAVAQTVRDIMAAPHNGVELSALSPEERQQVLDRRRDSMDQILETWTSSIELNARLNKETFLTRLKGVAVEKRAELMALPAPGPRIANTPAATPTPLLPGLDLSGATTTPALVGALALPDAGSVATFGPTMGQIAVAEQARTSGPVLVEHPAGQDIHDTVRTGLTQRLGYVPHRDVVNLVAENAQVRPDGRVSIPDRAAIITLYADTYGIDVNKGRVIIAEEHQRYADVLEGNFNFGPEGVPDWGARGLLIRTVMTMNGLQPRHNVEMPGVVVIPNDEAHFAELALAENGYAGQETRRFAGATVEPAQQVETAAGYLLRLRGQDPSDPTLLAAAKAEVEEMFANPSRLPSSGDEMRAYARTAADRNDPSNGQQWPRDAILETYKDLFNDPAFQDVPRDRLAAMIMMTVAQTNNLDPESFANCSQLMFINSERMVGLIRDAQSGDTSSHFASLDAMASDLAKLQGRSRTTAEMWQTITQHYAPGAGQVARRLTDGRPMPMVLIDSAAAMQPLSDEDMAKTEGLLMRSAYIRGQTENPINIFGFNIGGFLQTARVHMAATADPNARKPEESIADWVERTNPDATPAELASLRRQVNRAMPEVGRVLDELAAAGSGDGWRWENDRLVLDDVSKYRETVEGMNLSPKNREALLLWLDGSFKDRDISGTVIVDVEKLGVLHIDETTAARQSQSGGIHTTVDDLPPTYYKPPTKKDDDLYLLDGPGESSFGYGTNSYEENGSFIETIEKTDLRIVAARHNADAAKLEIAGKEIREHVTELRAYIADLRSDSKKYQEKIALMNRIVSQWSAKGTAFRGPLTLDLMRGTGLL